MVSDSFWSFIRFMMKWLVELSTVHRLVILTVKRTEANGWYQYGSIVGSLPSASESIQMEHTQCKARPVQRYKQNGICYNDM